MDPMPPKVEYLILASLIALVVAAAPHFEGVSLVPSVQ
jgi:hypothetical protein